MNFGGEDVVSFEKAGEEEKGEHDAGGPQEDLKRESIGERWARGGFGFAEDDSAQERDGG